MAARWLQQKKLKIKRDLRRRPKKYPSPANLAKEAVYELVQTESRKEMHENRSWPEMFQNNSRVKTVVHEPGNPGSTEPLLENSWVERRVVRTRFKNQDGTVWVKETKYQPRPIPETKPVTKQVFTDSPRSDVGKKLYEVRLAEHHQSITEFTKGPKLYELRGIGIWLYFNGGCYCLVKKGTDTLLKKTFNHRTAFYANRDLLLHSYACNTLCWFSI